MLIELAPVFGQPKRVDCRSAAEHSDSDGMQPTACLCKLQPALRLRHVLKGKHTATATRIFGRLQLLKTYLPRSFAAADQP